MKLDLDEVKSIIAKLQEVAAEQTPNQRMITGVLFVGQSFQWLSDVLEGLTISEEAQSQLLVAQTMILKELLDQIK